MAVYCIGDIHGCYDEFRHLLEEMAFNPACDELLLTGDIIGRGPKPLDTVRFIRDLGDRATFVLGNHDMNFLAIAYGFKEPKRKDLLQDLLSSPDLEDIAEWFSRAPLVFRHPRVPVCLVHAGIIPEWSIEDALAMSREAEETLRQPVTRSRFLQRMFADTPDRWDPELAGTDRIRFFVNVFTRIRLCRPDGSLDFKNKNSPEEAAQEGLRPWFELRKPASADAVSLVFGHWAALAGKCYIPGIKALDTGCVWGGRLTGWRCDTDTFYSVPSGYSIPLIKS